MSFEDELRERIARARASAEALSAEKESVAAGLPAAPPQPWRWTYSPGSAAACVSGHAEVEGLGSDVARTEVEDHGAVALIGGLDLPDDHILLRSSRDHHGR